MTATLAAACTAPGRSTTIPVTNEPNYQVTHGSTADPLLARWVGTYAVSGTVSGSAGALPQSYHLVGPFELSYEGTPGIALYPVGRDSASALGVDVGCVDKSCGHIVRIDFTEPTVRHRGNVSYGEMPQHPLAWLDLAVGASNHLRTTDGLYNMSVQRTTGTSWILRVYPWPDNDKPLHPYLRTLTIGWAADSPQPPWQRIHLTIDRVSDSNEIKADLILTAMT